jgi:hypothetical protein
MMKMEKTDRTTLAPNEFAFYLDAWVYCFKNQISLTSIKRKSWEVWEVQI